ELELLLEVSNNRAQPIVLGNEFFAIVVGRRRSRFAAGRRGAAAGCTLVVARRRLALPAQAPQDFFVFLGRCLVKAAALRACAVVTLPPLAGKHQEYLAGSGCQAAALGKAVFVAGKASECPKIAHTACRQSSALLEIASPLPRKQTPDRRSCLVCRQRRGLC